MFIFDLTCNSAIDTLVCFSVCLFVVIFVVVFGRLQPVYAKKNFKLFYLYRCTLQRRSALALNLQVSMHVTD